MRRKLHASVAIAAAAAALACALGAARVSPGPGPRATEIALALEGRLRERAAALAARVTTLSELPRLAAAVSTDATTVRDLSSEELAFQPRPGEVITIAQAFRDGHRLILLTMPDGVPGDTAALPGVQTRFTSGRLAMSHTTQIVPRARADELVGLLTVNWPVEAADLATGILDAGTAARLVLGTETMSFGASARDGTGSEATASVRLPGTASAPTIATLSIRGPAPQRGARGLWVGAALFSLVSLLASVRLFAGTKKRRPLPAESPAPELLPERVSSALDPMRAQPVDRAAATRVAPTRVGPAPATPAPVAGERRIGRYSILRPIGQGGMAEVYLARAEGEAGFGKLVAFKVLQPAFAAMPVVVDLFLDEARLVAGLDHPNIVQTQDLGLVDGQYFIAMEYVDGIDLARLLALVQKRGGRVPVPIALTILCRICDGLNAAHTSLGPDGQPLWLVHRDVKGANVFVSRAGAVKIGDFGIAKATHVVRVSRTEIGQVKGTPGYMAPEQRLGLDVDRRADLYSVGAIAYEILSGSPVNLDFVALAARGTDGWPHLPPLAASRSDVPPDLDAVIVKALAYERADRYKDCAELELALRAIGARTGLAEDKEIGAWTRAEIDRGEAERHGAGATRSY